MEKEEGRMKNEELKPDSTGGAGFFIRHSAIGI
jgi:hypothetical protein